MPHIPLLPTGGVSLDSAAAFIRGGAAIVGVGGEIVSAELLARRALMNDPWRRPNWTSKFGHWSFWRRSK